MDDTLSDGVGYHALLDSYKRTGFQATHFGKAVEEINKMVRALYITINRRKIIYFLRPSHVVYLG